MISNSNSIKTSHADFKLLRQHQKVLAFFSCDVENVSRYTLQRSVDKQHYETISVYHPFSGTPDLVKLVDESAPAGACYYRLKTLDRGGFSHEVVIELAPADAAEPFVSVSADPTRAPLLRFDIRNIPSPCEMVVVIYDGLGREITSFVHRLKKAGSQVFQENLVGTLNTGVYKVVTAFTDAIFSSTVLVRV